MSVFEDLYDELVNLLSKRGRKDGFGNGDFWVNANDYGHDAVGVFINNASIFDEHLVDEIQASLRRIDKTWSIFVTIELAQSEDDEWDADKTTTIEIFADRTVDRNNRPR